LEVQVSIAGGIRNKEMASNEESGTFVKVTDLDQIPEGDGTVVEIAGKEIGIFKIQGELFAISNLCPHMDGPLVEGELKGHVITCPWHAWTFDLKTGVCTFNDSIRAACFEVRVVGKDVELKV